MGKRRAQINVRVADGDLPRLDAAAERDGITRADALRRALAEYLARSEARAIDAMIAGEE